MEYRDSAHINICELYVNYKLFICMFFIEFLTNKLRTNYIILDYP